MEGKINKDGHLEILRGENFTSQYCPYNPYGECSKNCMTNCGDWCPLFEEPEFEGTADYNPRTKKTTILINSGNVTLKLCKAFLKFTSFVDERIHPTPENTKPATVELPKKRRGRPPKARPTDAQVIDLVTTLHPLQMPKEPDQEIYHDACKTCRKSSKDDAGNFPRCSMATFRTGSSGIETCEFWWEREGSRC